MKRPSREALQQALSDAGAAHHDYEQVVLKGEPDAQWPGFYAAYVLGRVGDFAPPSNLNGWLEDAPSDDDWAAAAAAYILAKLEGLQ